MPPLPLPIRLSLSRDDEGAKVGGRDDEGAEVGGRGRGTATEGTRGGIGKVRVVLRRRWGLAVGTGG